MPALVDSNILIGAFNPRDAFHKPASKLLHHIEQGKVSAPTITDYILDEVLTFVRRRLGFVKSLEVMESILASDTLNLDKVELGEFQAGIIIFEQHQRLSFTDSVSLAFMNSRGMREIYSFDKDFDGIRGIHRVTAP